MTQTKTPLQKYVELIKVRDALKPITQVSWSIRNLEKKFDVDHVDPSEYDDLLSLYLKFFKQVEDAYKDLKQIVETKNNETKNSLHKN